jgi:hypothetical protein
VLCLAAQSIQQTPCQPSCRQPIFQSHLQAQLSGRNVICSAFMSSASANHRCGPPQNVRR